MGFIRFSEIERVEFDETQYLKTGIKQLDKMICGFGLGQLVVLTGPRAGGKTTLIGNIICNFIEQGHYGFLFSFEMANPRLRRWLTLQALGKDNLKERHTQDGKAIYYPATKEKECIEDLYARIQRIAGTLQTYKISRAFEGSVSGDLQRLQEESDGIAADVAELRTFVVKA